MTAPTLSTRHTRRAPPSRFRVKWFIVGAMLVILSVLAVRLTTSVYAATPPTVPEVFASPVHAGCYLAKADRCKIHVEPFTINIAMGTRLAQFQLVAIRARTGLETVIYDWRPDQSNPAPAFGTTYTPSLVAKDFAARCGETYAISLQGKDTGDANIFNLGLTDQFTCPVGHYTDYLPTIRRN